MIANTEEAVSKDFTVNGATVHIEVASDKQSATVTTTQTIAAAAIVIKAGNAHYGYNLSDGELKADVSYVITGWAKNDISHVVILGSGALVTPATETVPETATETVPETATETAPETATETAPETPVHETVTAKVYLYLASNTVPATINTNFPAGMFGPSKNDVPYFTVNVDMTALLADKTVTKWTNNAGHWYISSENTGLDAKALWTKIFSAMSADDQAKFTDTFGKDVYLGYVLKNEGSVHIDGVLTVQPPIYHYDVVDVSNSEQTSAVTATRSDTAYTVAEIKREVETYLTEKYSADTIDWTAMTFTANGRSYTFTLTAEENRGTLDLANQTVSYVKSASKIDYNIAAFDLKISEVVTPTTETPTTETPKTETPTTETPKTETPTTETPKTETPTTETPTTETPKTETTTTETTTTETPTTETPTTETPKTETPTTETPKTETPTTETPATETPTTETPKTETPTTETPKTDTTTTETPKTETPTTETPKTDTTTTETPKTDTTTTETPKTETPTTDTPVTDTPVTEITDDTTPLAALPVTPVAPVTPVTPVTPAVPETTEEVVIVADDTPLGSLPNTGVAAAVDPIAVLGLAALGLALAGAGLGLVHDHRKNEDAE